MLFLSPADNNALQLTARQRASQVTFSFSLNADRAPQLKAIVRHLPDSIVPMRLPTSIILTLILMSALFGASPQKKEAVGATPKRSTLNLCDLIREPEAYNGKEVRFRSTYLSTFEHSAFVDGKCTDKDHMTWVEFDHEKLKSSTKPEIFERVKAQIFCCMYVGLEYFRETKVVVTGVFVSSPNPFMANGKYGHDSMYRFLVTVRSVHEIKPTKTIKVPGFDPKP